MGLDWFSEGWVPAAGHLDAPVYAARRQMVSLRREDKVLPASVIRDFVELKVAEIEDKELRKVGRKEKLALKEQITDDLLPRAFVRSSRMSAFLDTRRGWLMVDSAAASKAEALVSKLREALPPFPAALPRTKIAPHTAMTDWLAAGEAPAGFELDSDCELKDSGENGAVVRCARIDLTADEIRQHIATGKQVTSRPDLAGKDPLPADRYAAVEAAAVPGPVAGRSQPGRRRPRKPVRSHLHPDERGG